MALKEMRFDEIDNILYTKSIGMVNLEDMLKNLDNLSHDTVLPKHLKVVEDAREAIVTFSESELHLLAAKLELVADNFNLIKHAVVHSSPMNTALSILVSGMVKRENYYLKVFSTLEGAINWVRN